MCMRASKKNVQQCRLNPPQNFPCIRWKTQETGRLSNSATVSQSSINAIAPVGQKHSNRTVSTNKATMHSKFLAEMDELL